MNSQDSATAAPLSAASPSPATEPETAVTERRDREAKASRFRVLVALPILGFLLGAIVTEGQYFGTLHHVQALTREAGRATAMASTPAERQQAATETVNAIIGSYPLLDRDHVSVDVTEHETDPEVHEVRVKYAARPIGFWLLAGIAGVPSINIQQSLTIRHGGP